MIGYLTVGLILVLGGYFALLLACRTRERGVVVEEHLFLRYFRALAAAAVAVAEEMARLAAVVERAARSLAPVAREALGRDDVEVVFDSRPLLPQFGSFVPCATCGQPYAVHAFEMGFGFVCPTDAAARTENERFTYTRPEEWPA